MFVIRVTRRRLPSSLNNHVVSTSCRSSSVLWAWFVDRVALVEVVIGTSRVTLVEVVVGVGVGRIGVLLLPSVLSA